MQAAVMQHSNGGPRREQLTLSATKAPDAAVRQVDDADFDLATIAGIRDAKRRGVLPERFNQSRAEYHKNVARANAENFAKLRSGERQPFHRTLIDCDSRTGAYTSRVSRCGGPWSQPRVVAVSRTPAASSAQPYQTGRPRYTGRAPRRRTTRRRGNRTRAPSGSSDGPEADPGPADGPGSQFARADGRYGVVRFADVSVEGVSPTAFHAAIDRRLGPGVPGGVKLRIFAGLHEETRARFWSVVRAQADAEWERTNSQLEALGQAA
jgi:hypothetical protein